MGGSISFKDNKPMAEEGQEISHIFSGRVYIFPTHRIRDTIIATICWFVTLRSGAICDFITPPPIIFPYTVVKCLKLILNIKFSHFSYFLWFLDMHVMDIMFSLSRWSAFVFCLLPNLLLLQVWRMVHFCRFLPILDYSNSLQGEIIEDLPPSPFLQNTLRNMYITKTFLGS